MKSETTKLLDENTCWKAVVERDASWDGQFVYAVRSTGIFCNPSCASRQPKRENVAFFAAPHEAQAAGFRACKRCRPLEALDAGAQLDVVQRACRIIEDRLENPPNLDELAQMLHISPAHFHRTFKQATGLTPRQYAAGRKTELLKAQLRNGASVTDALYDTGYSSSSRLYEQSGARLGMTPGQYRQGGQGMQIRYALSDCTLGRLLVAATAQGVCAVRFGDDDDALIGELREEFPGAVISPDETGLQTWTNVLVQHLQGSHPRLDLPLVLRATAFQLRVWEALRNIPYGETRSYAEVAQAIGQPAAVRAVANACAANPAALITPCHRVVRSDGSPGGYRWGMQRKQALLERERCAEARRKPSA